MNKRFLLGLLVFFGSIQSHKQCAMMPEEKIELLVKCVMSCVILKIYKDLRVVVLPDERIGELGLMCGVIESCFISNISIKLSYFLLNKQRKENALTAVFLTGFLAGHLFHRKWSINEKRESPVKDFIKKIESTDPVVRAKPANKEDEEVCSVCRECISELIAKHTDLCELQCCKKLACKSDIIEYRRAYERQRLIHEHDPEWHDCTFQCMLCRVSDFEVKKVLFLEDKKA